jgi:hypothetical protein
MFTYQATVTPENTLKKPDFRGLLSEIAFPQPKNRVFQRKALALLPIDHDLSLSLLLI